MKKVILLSLCILWMGFIFYNSSKTGIDSNNTSFIIVNKITNEDKVNKNETIDKEASKEPSKEVSEVNKAVRDKINLFIRKTAHGIEYLILAILLALTMKSFDIKGREVIINTLFIVLLYAVTDEFHQLYVPGRIGRVEDIIIDFIGGIIGVFIYFVTRSQAPLLTR